MRRTRSQKIARAWSVVVPVCAFVIRVAAASSGGRLVGPSQQPPPPFQAVVDLVTIDVQVVPAKNAPTRECAR